jgi:hypothetical protein
MLLKYKILIFSTFFVVSAACAQKTDSTKGPVLLLPPALPNVFTLATTQKVPANFYTKSFGFFCKKELQFQKQFFPLRFRLGFGQIY